MALLQILVDILLPVFLIVGAGAVAGRKLDLDAKTLTRLVYWIVAPIFVFDILASADLSAGLVGQLMGATILAMAGAGVVAWLSAKALRRPHSISSAGVLSSVYGNVGNFGLAIVAFTFGNEALGAAGVILVVVNVFGVFIGIAAAQWHESGALKAIRMAFTAPMTLAVIPAAMVNAGDLTMPLWLGRPIDLVSAALIPMMLITLGVQLANMKTPRISMDLARALVVKLGVSPLIAAGAAMLVGLSGTSAGVVVLQLAMPPAVFTSIVALEHDLEPDLVTTTVFVGTLVSLFTLPVVISLLT